MDDTIPVGSSGPARQAQAAVYWMGGDPRWQPTGGEGAPHSHRDAPTSASWAAASAACGRPTG